MKVWEAAQLQERQFSFQKGLGCSVNHGTLTIKASDLIPFPKTWGSSFTPTIGACLLAVELLGWASLLTLRVFLFIACSGKRLHISHRRQRCSHCTQKSPRKEIVSKKLNGKQVGSLQLQRCPQHCKDYHEQLWLIHGGDPSKMERVPAELGLA